MLIDGEKFACSSCIKGHRVSGCMHTDRELHHINPKGRPVKQCEHCRGARKSKSHHAKCDCGEKKDKDKHKDKGDAKGMEYASISDDLHSNDATDAEGRCCCHSGGKCICGVKKEALDLKLDTGKQTLHAARTKPKLTTTHSESTLTVFANGHHKPCHRNNNTAHVSGAPYSYKLGRPHTLHGPSAFAAFGQGTSRAQSEATAPRAMDTHSLSNNDYYAFLGSAQRSVNALADAPVTSSYDSNGFSDALFTSQNTTFGQESNSPGDSPLGDVLSAQQWPWSSSITPLNRNFGFGSLSTSPSQDCLPNLDNDWAIPSAGLNNPLWSAGDLPLDPSKLSDTLGQPLSNPGLTNGSSAQSEIGEPALFGDLDFHKTAQSTVGELEFKAPPSTVSETLFWEDSPAFRIATSGPSDVPSAPTSAPSSTASPDHQALEMDFVRGFGSEGIAMTGVSNSGKGAAVSFEPAFSEPGAIAIPNSIDDIDTNDPWLPDFDLNDFKPSYQFNWP